MIDVVNMHQFASHIIGARMAKAEYIGNSMRSRLQPKEGKPGQPEKKPEADAEQQKDPGLPKEHPLNFTTDWKTHPYLSQDPVALNHHRQNRAAMSDMSSRAQAFDQAIAQRLAEMRNQTP